MPGRWRPLVVLGLTVIAMSPGKAVAQVTLQGSVNAPSTGNELTIEVSNVSAEAPVEGLRVALAAQPRHLTNVSILPERVPAVMPGQGVEFTIRFDVRPDAPAGQAETLALRVTAERGTTIDFPTPRLTVTFVKPAPPAAASAPASAAPPGAPKVLKLVKISMGEGRRFLGEPTDRTVYAYQEGQSGFVARTGSSSQGSVASVRVLRAPTEIALDRPFEVEVEARWRGNLPPDHRCENPATRNQSPSASRGSVSVWLGLDSDAELSASTRTPEDMRVFCRSTEQYYQEAWTPPRRPAAAVDGLARVTLQVIPAKVEQLRRTAVFHFRGTASSSYGTQSRARIAPVPLMEWDPSSSSPARLRVNVGALGGKVLYLRYEGGTAAGPAVAALPPYEHPGDMRQPPRSDAVVAAPPGTPSSGTPGAPRTGDPATSGAAPGVSGPATSSLGPGSSGIPGTSPAGGSTGLPAGSPPGRVDPGRLDPRSPDVAPLIRQWIGVAEPPDNARGARLRYDEWGRMVGTGVNREQITAGARPDAAGGMGSTEYVWTLRDRLDSVNHCRLGEYVGAMLSGDSIAGCQDRYKAPPLRRLLSLGGLPAQEAEARVRALGLVPHMIGGDPAPSPEREYTVQSQVPQGGSQVREGERVALRIHSGYVDPRRPVPAVLGLPRAEAEARVRAAGFRPLASGGTEPSPSGQEGVVEEQFPTEGTRLFPGSQVTLKVASRPAPTQPPAGSGEATPRAGARPGEGPRSGEPEICATYYSNLPDLGRGANTRMAQLAAQSAVAAGCDPGRVQQAVTGTLSPSQPGLGPSVPVAPPPPPPPAVSWPPPAAPASPPAHPWPGPPQGAPPQYGGGAEPQACSRYYSTLTELARADDGPNGTVARMTAQSALQAGCSPQRVQQSLAAGAASPYSRRAAPPASPPSSTAAPQRVTPPPAEPAVCTTHYSNLYQWSRSYPGGSTHQAVQNEARRALAAGCNRQRVEQLIAQGRPQTPQRPSGGVNTAPPASQGRPPAGECPGGGTPLLGQC